MDEFSGALPAAARAHATGALGPDEHLPQSEWNDGLGLLSMGIRSGGRWNTDRGPRANYVSAGEKRQKLADCARSHFCGANDKTATKRSGRGAREHTRPGEQTSIEVVARQGTSGRIRNSA